MTYWPSLTFLHEWFVEKRGLAGGLMLAGGGVGGQLQLQAHCRSRQLTIVIYRVGFPPAP